MKLFAIPSRVYFRMKLFGFNFTFNFAHIQTLEGVSSLIPNSNGKHIVLWDIEGCSQEQAEGTLRKVQTSYSLSNIFIVSNTPRSFRAWCFSIVDFKTLRKILLDTDYVDENFIDYTNRRKKATLRVSNKKNRPKQELVSVLESYSVPIPKVVEKVIYDTGIEKMGISIILGDEL